MEGIRVFSNGSEYDSWQSVNCERCCRYENKSTTIGRARCKLAFLLDLGEDLDIEVAKQIGLDSNNIILPICNDFNKDIPKRSYKRKIDIKQTLIY